MTEKQESIFYYTVWRAYTPVIRCPVRGDYALRSLSRPVPPAHRFASKEEACRVAAELAAELGTDKPLDVQEDFGPINWERPPLKLSKPWGADRHPCK